MRIRIRNPVYLILFQGDADPGFLLNEGQNPEEGLFGKKIWEVVSGISRSP
jgi:hypothetical protein